MLVFALVAGCGDGLNADGGSDTTGPEPTGNEPTGNDPTTGVDPTPGGTSDGLCVPGYEGCPCFDDARCITGLSCLSNFCVSVPPPGDTTSGDGSTSAAVESSSTDATEDSSSGGDESSSTGVVAVCVDDDTYCNDDDDDLQTCVGGQWEFSSCDEVCEPMGYATTGCADADACQCEGHSDAFCDLSTYNHCICIDALYGVVACTTAQQESEYQACFAETTAANTCWGEYPVQTIEDCEMFVAECGA